MKPKSKVTRITVARLYSTGNYEHTRYEIQADVNGGSPSATMIDLLTILARLKPIRKPIDYNHAVEVLNKPEEQLTEGEKANVDGYAETVKNYQGAVALRWDAIQKLDAVGGVSRKGGGKSSEDFDDEPF